MVVFKWDAEEFAGLVAELVGLFAHEDLRPTVSADEAMSFSLESVSGNELMRMSLDGFPDSAKRVHDHLLRDEVHAVFVSHVSMAPQSMLSVIRGHGNVAESACLRWTLADQAMLPRPGFAGRVTEVLATVAGQVDAHFGGCSGPHGYGFGAYAAVANPLAKWGTDNSVLLDHDWQVLIPPPALTKLDEGRLAAVAVGGEYRSFDSPDGNHGAVVRLSDDVTQITQDDWAAWYGVLSPALIAHERIRRPLRHAPPRHIATEDWTVLSHSEIDKMLGINQHD